MQKSYSDKLLIYSIYAVMIFFTIVCLYPLLLTVMISFSDELMVNKYGYSLIPKKLSLDTYSYLWEKNSQEIFHAYIVTFAVTISGTLLSIFVSSMLAYTMSQNHARYRNVISFYCYFTVIFSAGIVPWYIVCVNILNITNKFHGLVLPYLVNVWNLFLLRNYFQSIPVSISESAKIDGANDFAIYYRLIMPMSKTAILTVGLFYALQYWNDWWLSIMLITKRDLFPLQYYLFNILSSAQAASESSIRIAVPKNTVKMAVTVITIGPIILLYPIVQKYFVKGIIIGAIKG
jgi:putative aldouronate transport system permease protein